MIRDTLLSAHHKNGSQCSPLKQTLGSPYLLPHHDSVSPPINGDTMTVLNLFAKYIESLEVKVVFSVSSKPDVIILLPILFLRFFCLLGLQTQA